MQDRYTADIGDYAKYGLLRWMAKRTQQALGIAWYLVPNEDHNEDGRYTNYFDWPEEYRRYDPECFDALEKIVKTNNRNTQAIESSSLFHHATYHNRRYDAQSIPASKRARTRQEWIKEAADFLKHCPFLFLDPDNGLSIASTTEGSKKAGKFVYNEDLVTFWQTKPQALICYQHVTRTGDVKTQAARHRERVTELLGVEPRTIYWLAYSLRIFIIISPNPQVYKAVDELLTSQWGKLFKTV